MSIDDDLRHSIEGFRPSVGGLDVPPPDFRSEGKSANAWPSRVFALAAGLIVIMVGAAGLTIVLRDTPESIEVATVEDSEPPTPDEGLEQRPPAEEVTPSTLRVPAQDDRPDEATSGEPVPVESDPEVALSKADPGGSVEPVVGFQAFNPSGSLVLLKKQAAGQVRYVVVEVETETELVNFAAEPEGGLFWWDNSRPDVLYYGRAGSAELVEVAARGGNTSVVYEFDGCDRITFGSLVGSVGFASGHIGVICVAGTERLWAVYGMEAGAEVVERSQALVDGAPIPLGVFNGYFVAVSEDGAMFLEPDLSVAATVLEEPITSYAIVRDAEGVDQLVASLGSRSSFPGAIFAVNLIAGTHYHLYGTEASLWPGLPGAVVQGAASGGKVVAVSSPTQVDLVTLEVENHTKRPLEGVPATDPAVALVPRVALNSAATASVYSTDAASPGTVDSYLVRTE